MSHRSQIPSRFLRRSLSVAPILGALLLSLHCRAQGPDPARARALFEEGKAAAARQDWTGAFELFQQSWAASASYDTAGNLGQTAYKLGQYDTAARFLSYSLRHFPPSGDRDKRNAVTTLLDLASKEVTKIELTVEPEDADVAVDGMRAGSAASLEGELFVLPGDHTIEARSSGFATERQRITAQKGAALAVKLTLPRETAAEPSTAPSASPSAASASAPAASSAPASASASAASGIAPPPQPGHDARPDEGPNVAPLIIESGAFAAALAVGIGFRLSSDSDLRAARSLQKQLGDSSSCTGPQPPSRCADLPSLYDSVNTKRNVSTVGFVAAGVALLAGGVTAATLYWPRDKGDRTAALSTRSTFSTFSTLSTQVEPQIGSKFTGLTLTGEF